MRSRFACLSAYSHQRTFRALPAALRVLALVRGVLLEKRRREIDVRKILGRRQVHPGGGLRHCRTRPSPSAHVGTSRRATAHEHRDIHGLTTEAAVEVGVVEILNVEVAGVLFEREIFVPFSLQDQSVSIYCEVAVG